MALYLGIANDGTFVSLDNYRLRSLDDLLLYAMPESSQWKINLNDAIYRLNINLDTKESE